MDAITALRTRRSTRAFSPEPVARALIGELIEDVLHAPYTPGAGASPWRFTVISGPKRLAGYGDRALHYARANRPRIEGYEWTERAGFSVFHGAPAAIVICGREDYAQALQECIRAGQLLDIAAHARGLGVCWVGSPMLWLGDAAVRAELAIPEGWTACAVFVLGWPYGEEGRAPSARPEPTIDWIGEEL